MKKFRWLAIMMGITILGITGFQGYWLKNNYDREKQNLEIKTNADFRETILRIQAAKLKLERINIQFDSVKEPMKANIVVKRGRKNGVQDTIVYKRGKDAQITLITLLEEKMRDERMDSLKKKAFLIGEDLGFSQKLSIDSLKKIHKVRSFDGKAEIISVTCDSSQAARIIDSIRRIGKNNVIAIKYRKKQGHSNEPDSIVVNSSENIFMERHDGGMPPANVLFDQKLPDPRSGNGFYRFLSNIDSVSIRDSVTVKEISSAYLDKLKENKMKDLSWLVTRLDSTHTASEGPNDVTIGFIKPLIFRLSLENKLSYLLKKLTLPILFSLFLVGITVVSFVLLYRNLVRQRRLAELKNDFISNITHELKTPIATVGVAIEALKNFNAIDDPKRTREYLDISENELQRLSLLVDKVLKLSMFEKKEIELKKEQFDCKQLVTEVMTSMRLQFEKYRAKVKLHTEGNNFIVEADKLHITSVIYNLLDNALKYSKDQPVITISLKAKEQHIELSVEDNGIGIPAEYKRKIFDKFFRVPTGDRHNAKGYGLGLSYVSEIIKKHFGFITVESEFGRGSIFTAYLPYRELPVIRFDEQRKIKKEI